MKTIILVIALATLISGCAEHYDALHQSGGIEGDSIWVRRRDVNTGDDTVYYCMANRDDAKHAAFPACYRADKMYTEIIKGVPASGH